MDGAMARTRHKPEEIVAKLPQLEVLRGQGASIAEAVKTIAVAETTYFRWRAECGGMKSDQVKRVQRIWRREGLKVPHKQPKRGRLWLNDGSCVRLRAERPNHVWSYDFVEDRTHDGRKFRMPRLIDEFTHEALAIRVKRKLNATDVLETLADVMILRGRPAYVRSDNRPEFVALALRAWIAAVGAKTACIEPDSPWENGYCESFNSKLRDELLNGEIFFSLAEAQALIEAWRRHDNTVRPHSSLGCRPPAPETIVPRSDGVAPWPSAPAVGFRNARHWRDQLVADSRVSIASIAAREKRRERSIRQILSLAFLDPALVEAALQGHRPGGFGLKPLLDLPVAWAEQWTRLGLEALPAPDRPGA